MKWTMKHPRMTLGMLGYIPQIIIESDPRSAREQINDRYAHGGGFNSFKGFKMLPNGNLKYPGDPETKLLAETKLRNETIRFYEHSWVAVIQPDGSFEISRMD